MVNYFSHHTADHFVFTHLGVHVRQCEFVFEYRNTTYHCHKIFQMAAILEMKWEKRSYICSLFWKIRHQTLRFHFSLCLMYHTEYKDLAQRILWVSKLPSQSLTQECKLQWWYPQLWPTVTWVWHKLSWESLKQKVRENYKK